VLDALDDVFLVDLLAGALVDALVAHRVHGALVEPVEVDVALLGGRIAAPTGMCTRPKRDGAFPPVLIAGGGPVGPDAGRAAGAPGHRAAWWSRPTPAIAPAAAPSASRAARRKSSAGPAPAAALAAKALPWTGGRSYFRDREVLHFQMPSEPTQRFAPMVNIQQFYVEQFVHEALAGRPGAGRLVGTRRRRAAGWKRASPWTSKQPGRPRAVQADWLVACDGGRSTVREQLGLQLEGTQYEGRYVIVDIVQPTRGRWSGWPGSTRRPTPAPRS
jgi:2-polyprenyl-6-methoxyphenol hydroxylase-like FAD-dependent oxidoreductase